MDDLNYHNDIIRGNKGKRVKLVQEWLCLHGFNVAVDEDFGPATEKAVKEFQGAKGLDPDGKVGKDTFPLLVKPMKDAILDIQPDGRALGQMICAYAEQHLAQQPREIGGQNCGPWVRLYMDGKEGEKQYWCAGFVSFILKQACESIGQSLPIKTSTSCDELAWDAQKNGLFKTGKSIADKTQIPPGSIFLNFKSKGDWDHTGIVIAAEEECFQTIEGNTNDDHSHNGYAVFKLHRGYINPKKDFIVFT
jgi:peptidoglycan hydrolase-like protein with peptidoglycan-binding domain